MQTKRQIWDKVNELITFNQYRRMQRLTPSFSFDDKFTAILKISKSKKIRQLCLAGHFAPLVITPEFNRSMMSVIECNDLAVKTYQGQLQLVGAA